MDWELYERYRASVLLLAIFVFSILLLLFQHAPVVRHLRVILVRTTLPIDRFLSDLRAPEDLGETSAPEAAVSSPPSSAPAWAEGSEMARHLSVLLLENKRLNDLVGLRQQRWPQAVAAHVTGRDPFRWFQEIVLDKGRDDGMNVDDPVVAVNNGREGLVGRVIEVGGHVARVMLIQDSLSAVAATVHTDRSEDGVVEGTNSHDLVLKFLDRSSHIKVGDPVVTSGLGKAFPAGIPIGSVLDLGLDARQLFLEAHLRPAVAANQLQVVLVLTQPSTAEPQ